MKFAIRDDDTNFFTTPEELENCYSDIWNVCPISLSIVPFVKGRWDIFITEYLKNYNIKSIVLQDKDRIFPIGENNELITFLKKKIRENKISVNIHGIHHRRDIDGKEFFTKEDLTNELAKGIEYLENLFQIKIKTFVPPHNTISKEGYLAIIHNNLNLVGSLSVRKRSTKYILTYLKLKIFKLRYKHSYPYILKFKDHSEVRYYSLTPQVSYDMLKESFDFVYKMNGVFILSTHYWEFNSSQNYNENLKMKDVLNKFFKYVSTHNNVEFLSVNEIF
jgi:hypothetical protein